MASDLQCVGFIFFASLFYFVTTDYSFYGHLEFLPLESVSEKTPKEMLYTSFYFVHNLFEYQYEQIKK